MKYVSNGEMSNGNISKQTLSPPAHAMSEGAPGVAAGAPNTLISPRCDEGGQQGRVGLGEVRWVKRGLLQVQCDTL